MKQNTLWVLCLCLVTLIGCETVEGVGQDMENTGENIKETVDKNK